jgi:hypothetical protein
MSVLGFSPLDLAFTVVVAVVLLFYAIFLVESKPPKEKKVILIGDLRSERRDVGQPRASPRTTTHVGTKTGRLGVAEKRKMSTMQGDRAKFPQIAMNVEAQRSTDDKGAKKSLFLFGVENFQGCQHAFGHLSGLAKNTPIPDECFGCPQILDCLNQSRKEPEILVDTFPAQEERTE